ncbi:peroxidase 2-like [Macadamia integrifolia]|uniref:peroxidase 2-like n=1 Tax=Macadamia integrifolia TaxID=60698 RepID=UPI001C531089|nr:peroxidase 2-like [Macadamia integrifolia]
MAGRQKKVLFLDCDGSILLDGPNSEKNAPPNSNSVRGFKVVDNIKEKVEVMCPGVVSCADIVAIAASESGAHTIGFAKCANFRSRIYNDINIDKEFAKSVQLVCPRIGGGNNNLSLDNTESVSDFDTSYFQKITQEKGLLHADQELFNGGTADNIVLGFRDNSTVFFESFATVMMKMGSISPLTGEGGIIRKKCKSAIGRLNVEKDAAPNKNSASGFEVVESIKEEVEAICPRDISCAKILTIAAFESVSLHTQEKELLHSGLELFKGGSGDSIVLRFGDNSRHFLQAFYSAMIKIGNISPLTGEKGIIRKKNAIQQWRIN